MRVETASDVPGTNQQQLGGIAGAAAIQLQGRLSDIAPVSDKKAFDTVPRAVLWQVLEELGVHGRILDIIKALYAHDSAAVQSYRHFFHLQRSHGGEPRMSAESNSV
ncbi:TPA: hypothetical protein ACH3X2_000789 [Trebouxia sp. C0005]